MFPAGSRSGHPEESSAKITHGAACRTLGAASAAFKAWKKNGSVEKWEDAVITAASLDAAYLEEHGAVIQSGFTAFEPYCLRHSALTMLAESGCDAFTLARIAGHSSITITQRYCHPQADAIERAFTKLGEHNKLPQLPKANA